METLEQECNTLHRSSMKCYHDGTRNSIKFPTKDMYSSNGVDLQSNPVVNRKVSLRGEDMLVRALSSVRPVWEGSLCPPLMQPMQVSTDKKHQNGVPLKENVKNVLRRKINSSIGGTDLLSNGIEHEKDDTRDSKIQQKQKAVVDAINETEEKGIHMVEDTRSSQDANSLRFLIFDRDADSTNKIEGFSPYLLDQKTNETVHGTQRILEHISNNLL